MRPVNVYLSTCLGNVCTHTPVNQASGLVKYLPGDFRHEHACSPSIEAPRLQHWAVSFHLPSVVLYGEDHIDARQLRVVHAHCHLPIPAGVLGKLVHAAGVL